MRGSWTSGSMPIPRPTPLADTTLPRRGFRARAAGLRGQRRPTRRSRPATPTDDRCRGQVSLRRHRARPRDRGRRRSCARRRTLAAYPGYTFGRARRHHRDRPRAARRRRHHRRGRQRRRRGRRCPSRRSTTRPLEAQIAAAPRRHQRPHRRAQPDAGRCWPTVDRIGIKPQLQRSRRPRRGQRSAASTSSPSRPTARPSPRPASTGRCRASRPTTSGTATTAPGSGKPSPPPAKSPTARSIRRPAARSPSRAKVDWGRYQLEVESTGDDADLDQLRVLCRLVLCRGRLRHARHAAGRARQAGLQASATPPTSSSTRSSPAPRW